MIPLLLLAAAHAAPLTGNVSASASDVQTTGVPFGVQHAAGAVNVTCAPGSTASANVSYTLDGPDAALVQSLAKEIKVTVTKSPDGGAQVAVSTPAGLSSLPVAKVDLTVTLPTKALLDVAGGAGTVAITGCQGKVKSRNTMGGVTLAGTYTKVDVVSAQGPITANLGAATLADTSTIQAQNGNITVQMPDISANLTATGQNITVQMPDFRPTTLTPTQVVGTNKTGGAMLTIQAPMGWMLLK